MQREGAKSSCMTSELVKYLHGSVLPVIAFLVPWDSPQLRRKSISMIPVLQGLSSVRDFSTVSRLVSGRVRILS
jgi:hypothetical protein